MLVKNRLDILLVEKGLIESREKAKSLIMAGQVYVNGQKADKPGMSYSTDSNIEIKIDKLPYVSRGGLKLEKSIEEWDIDLKDKITMDIGASTGGFTDCMLQNGAKKVYAIDVGYGQLAWKLRQDERVVNLERTNVRYITREQIIDPIDFFSVDVSFISLQLILPVVRKFMSRSARAVCLIKPQFEAGRENVGKNGVVRDSKVHVKVVEKICSFVLENGFDILGLSFSPIKGPKGNIEYLIYIEKSDDPKCYLKDEIELIVNKSHSELD